MANLVKMYEDGLKKFREGKAPTGRANESLPLGDSGLSLSLFWPDDADGPVSVSVTGQGKPKSISMGVFLKVARPEALAVAERLFDAHPKAKATTKARK